MKRFIQIILLITIAFPVFSQNCELSSNTVTANTLCPAISSALSADSFTLRARDGIIFQPGFQLGSAQFSGHRFTARLDHTLANQLNEYVETPTSGSGSTYTLDKSSCIPGTIGGVVNVSPSGAATYQLPIQVSPGSHGMQPNLSIVYSSQSGNGPLGWGWNLTGPSIITRANKVGYYNGTFEPISLASTKTLTLDGVRLTNLTADSTVYYPVNNPYTRITYSGNTFTAVTQDGTTLVFGGTADSRLMVDSSSTPLVWAVSRVSDPEGNYIDYSYTTNSTTGEQYLSEIKYTGNSQTGKSPYNSVKFYYDKRSDVNTMYVAGESITQNTLLTGIKVYSEGSLSKDYEFTYFYDGYSKLYSIALTADGVKYNPTVISWGSSTDYTTSVSNPSWGSLATGQLYFGDFNGDGVADRAMYPGGQSVGVWITGGSSYTVSLPSNTTTTTTSGIRTSKMYTIQRVDVADWNSDGKDEVLVHYTYSLDVYNPTLNLPAEEEETYTEWDRVNCYTYSSGDFTSATIRDVTSQETVTIDNSNPDEYSFYYADFNNDGSIDRLVVKNKVFSGCEGITLSSTPSISNVEDVKMMDFDGDGRVEFVALSSLGGSIWEYQESTQTFVRRFYATSNALFGNFPYITVGDFNGDGKTDFIGKKYGTSEWYLEFSTGTGFVAGTLPDALNSTTIQEATDDLPGQSCQLASVETVISPSKTIGADDINGDGKSEIIVERGQVLYAYALNNGAFSPCFSRDLSSYYTTASRDGSFSVFYPVDLDGDGQKEFIWGSSSYTLYVNGSVTYEPYRKIAFTYPLNRSGYISSITDGMGNTSQFIYSTYTDSRIFGSTFTKPAYPQLLLRGPMRIATGLTTTNGSDTTASFTYGFADGYLHLGGLGFLGFKTVSTANNIDNSASTSTFDYTITGASNLLSPWLKKQTVSKADTAVSEVNNTMSVGKLIPDKRVFVPYVRTTVATDQLTGITTTTTTTFDSIQGRVTCQEVTTTGWSVKTETAYQTVSGSVNKPVSVTTTKTHGGKTYASTTAIGYDSSLPLRVVSKTEGGATSTYSSFDPYGNPQSVSVTAGGITRSTSCAYEGKGRAVASTTDLLGSITSYTYRWGDGARLTETTAMGTTAYAYSASGGKLMVTTSYPNGTVGVKEVGWNSSDNGYYSKESVSYGNTVTTYFNPLGQKVTQTAFGFNGAQLTSTYTYDQQGRLSTETQLGVTNTYSYDDFDRVSRVVASTGQSMSYSYPGNTVTTNSSVSGSETKTYDALGNVISITGDKGDITYNYLASGKVGSITAAGETTTMEYDSITLLQTKLVDPDAGTTTYTYNGFGQMLTQTDAKLQTVTCTYSDTTGLLSTKTGAVNEEYHYYRQNSPKLNGLLSSVTRDGVTETYGYDDWGRTTSVAIKENGKTPFTTTYTYNDQQRLDRVNYPSGLSVQYGYDDIGNVKTITDVNTSIVLWTGNSKNTHDQWAQFTLGNGLITKWGYNATSNQLSSIQTGTTTSPTSVQNLGFNFNDKGQLTSRTEGSLTESFGYDALNRLISSTIGSKTYAYAYSPNGNIDSTSLAGKYSYLSAHPHAVGTVAGVSSVGQSPSVTTTSTFTADNMVATVTNGTYTHTFTYDPSGNRFKVERKTGGVVTSTKIYVGSSEFLYDGSGTLLCKRTLVYAPTGACAVYQDSASVKAFYYVHTDYLGSWLRITNESGTVTNRYSYDAWGRPRSPSTWVLIPISTTSPLANLSAMQPRFDRGYTGHEHMAGFGLINMNGRLYDPYLQRFLSPDPFVQAPGNSQSYNRYTYCLNNPLMYTDPSGYTWWSHFTGWVGEHWKPIVTTTVAIAVAVAVTYATAGLGNMVATGCLAGMAGGFSGGFTGVALNGGSFRDCMYAACRGGLWGGISGAAAAGVMSGIAYGLDNIYYGYDISGVPGGTFALHTFPTQSNHALASLFPHVGNILSGVSNGTLAAGIGGAVFSEAICTEGMRSNIMAMPEMSPRPKVGTPWMTIAEKEIGVEEGFLRSNPRILEYLKSAGNIGDSDETPWCASFAHWCFAQCEIQGAGVNGFDYSNWGQTIKDPVYGALAITKEGHVGFYTGMDGEWVKLLGGNQHDMVSNSRFCKKSDILKYVYPTGYLPL